MTILCALYKHINTAAIRLAELRLLSKDFLCANLTSLCLKSFFCQGVLGRAHRSVKFPSGYFAASQILCRFDAKISRTVLEWLCLFLQGFISITFPDFSAQAFLRTACPLERPLSACSPRRKPQKIRVLIQCPPSCSLKTPLCTFH